MPRWLTMLRLRLRFLLFRAHVERELEDELQYHLERELEQQREAGLPEEEARLAARRAMGAIPQNMETCRDMRGVNVIEHGIHDLRFALRQLLINPGFACTAILVLTLGIAATVTIFGFVDAALVRPLPYTDPLRLVHVFGTRPELVDTQDRGSVSYQDFRDWRQRNRAFRSIAAYDVRAGFNVQQLAMLSVSPVSVPTGSPNKSEPTGASAQQVAERVAAVPGVVSVGYADLLPLAPGLAPTSTFRISGRPSAIS
jgi:hypothetical protein